MSVIHEHVNLEYMYVRLCVVCVCICLCMYSMCGVSVFVLCQVLHVQEHTLWLILFEVCVYQRSRLRSLCRDEGG